MKFRGTGMALGIAAVLGLFVYWHEVKGGKAGQIKREQMAKLLPMQRADVQGVRIVHSGTQFNLQPEKNGTWVLTQPVSAPCDPAVLSAFLDTLAAARREEQVGSGDLVRYGLDHPAARVEIATAGGTHRLQLGQLNPLQTLVYTLVDDSKDVVLTTSSLLTLSLNSAFGWRDKRMIDISPDLVQRMKFRTLVADETALRRDPRHGWIVDGPVAWRVDPVRAQSALLGLAQLKAVGISAENKGNLAKYGADNRRFSVLLEGSGGRVVGDVAFGFALVEGAYNAIVPDKPEVFQVDGKLCDVIAGLARDPRDHKAMPPFEPSQVTRIQVKTIGDQFTLTRRSMTHWVVSSSTKADTSFALDPGKILALVENMASIEVTGFPEQQPPPSMYEPPTISVTVYAGDKLVSGLEVGQKDPHGMSTLCRGIGEPASFLLSPSSLLNLPFDLERLQLDELPAPETGSRT